MSEEQQNQPGLLGEIVEGMHNLEQKVENFIHEGHAGEHLVQPGDNATVEGVVAADGPPLVLDTAPSSTEPMQEAGGAAAGEPANAGDAPKTVDLGESMINVAEAANQPLPTSEGSEPAVADAAEQSSSPSSGSPDGGIIGVIDETENVAGNVGLAAIGAASTIKAHLQAIRQYLSLRGFEVALVQDIHNELAAIERLL